jgi:integrase
MATFQERLSQPMSNANFYVFRADETLLKKKGFGSIAHVPVIFDGAWRYQAEVSRYLRERATPTLADVECGAIRTNRRPTRASLNTFAAQLANFLEWCAARGKDWKNVDYDLDVVAGYEQEMATGSFTADGRPLENSTINQRVDTACSLLVWAAKKGLRKPFDVPAVTRSYLQFDATSTHARVVQSTTRINKRRLKPKNLRIPTDDEIGKWLNAVRIRYGRTKALMVELVLHTGVRRQEVVDWRIDTLPEDRSKWRVSPIAATKVIVTIEHGTKGPKTLAGDAEVGPPRNIVVPLNLANRLWHYIEFERPKLLKTYIKAGKTKSEQDERRRNPPRQLFLSDFTGVPVSAQKFYEAWTSAPALPFTGWSPHLGRHYWACKTLLGELDRMRKQTKEVLKSSLPVTWITGSATDIIELTIQPQLGHVDKKTTQMYLTWVRDVYDIVELHNAYARELSDITAEELA